MALFSFLRRKLSIDREAVPGPHYRIAVLGSSGAGKTSIISQFTGKVWPENETHYKIDREVLVSGSGTELTLDIVDTSGIHYSTILQLCIGRSDAFILVYSTDDSDSFDALSRFRRQIIKEKNDQTVPIVVVANKMDLPEEARFVSPESVDYLVRHKWRYECMDITSGSYADVCRVFVALFRKLVPHLSLSSALESRWIFRNRGREKTGVIGYLRRVLGRKTVIVTRSEQQS